MSPQTLKPKNSAGLKECWSACWLSGRVSPLRSFLSRVSSFWKSSNFICEAWNRSCGSGRGYTHVSLPASCRQTHTHRHKCLLVSEEHHKHHYESFYRVFVLNMSNSWSEDSNESTRQKNKFGTKVRVWKEIKRCEGKVAPDRSVWGSTWRCTPADFSHCPACGGKKETEAVFSCSSNTSLFITATISCAQKCE